MYFAVVIILTKQCRCNKIKIIELQLLAIGSGSLEIRYFMVFVMEKIVMKKMANNWEQVKYKSYKFPVVSVTEHFDISRVHPFMQAGAIKISDSVREDDRVVALILFGSSTNIRCNEKSDFDILVRLRDEAVSLETKAEVSEKIQEACNWNADLIWYDKLDPKERIYQHILKGVQIL